MSKRADRRRERHQDKSARAAAPARRAASEEPGSTIEGLARLFDTALLAEVVPRLAPELLHQLIQYRGLEASGALVAAATPEQVTALLDLDLWHAMSPRGDDEFDPQRFGAWMEALMEEGDAAAARVVAAMDRRVAVAGLSRYVRVFDPGVLTPGSGNDEGVEQPAVSQPRNLECEVGGYVLRAITEHTWDAIVGLLATLADHHPDAFHALMQGCRRLSNSTPEADGFHELMLEPDQLLHDVSLDREGRRTQQGYLTAADARAFLDVARAKKPPGAAASTNAIAAAYLRTRATGGTDDRPAQVEEHSAERANTPPVSESADAVAELVKAVAVVSVRPRALLGPVHEETPRLVPLESFLERLHETDRDAHAARFHELAFLANALRAGCSVHGRAFTAREAWDAASGTCNLGLERLLEGRSGTGADLITAFEAGWRLLHEDVSLFVIERLIATLTDLRRVDSTTQRDLYRLRRELERNRDAGTPWHARDILDPIAILDTPAWACLLGLLSECPVWPSALTAVLERHAGSVSVTAFECFTTTDQILRARAFAETLHNRLLN